jgi:hypothetical protein
MRYAIIIGYFCDLTQQTFLVKIAIKVPIIGRRIHGNQNELPRIDFEST